MDHRVLRTSGEVASGKSSIAVSLLDLLPGWSRVSTGERFRAHCAAEHAGRLPGLPAAVLNPDKEA